MIKEVTISAHHGDSAAEGLELSDIIRVTTDKGQVMEVTFMGDGISVRCLRDTIAVRPASGNAVRIDCVPYHGPY